MTTQKGTEADAPVDVPEVLSILPLRNSVLFPGSIIPIDVGRKKSVRLVEDAISKERPIIGIVTQRDARTEEPNDGDLFSVGCAARILKVIKLAKDNFSVILQGVARIRLLDHTQTDPFIVSHVQTVPDLTKPDVELDALVLNLKDMAKRVVKLMPELPKVSSSPFVHQDLREPLSRSLSRSSGLSSGFLPSRQSWDISAGERLSTRPRSDAYDPSRGSTSSVLQERPGQRSRRKTRSIT